MANLDRDYMTLEKLNENSANCEIIVRLIRQWEARNPKRGNQLMSLDLLLLDEELSDVLIKASINYRLITKHKFMLQEDNVFQIKNFDIVKANEKYKLTYHKFNIYFNQQTNVVEVLDDIPHINKTKFRIREHSILFMLASTNEELPDVIGKIISVSGANLHDITSIEKVVANLMLNNGSKVRSKIWDKISSEFRAFLSSIKGNKSVIIVTAVNPKMFSNELYLNTTSATRFYNGEGFDSESTYVEMQNVDDNASLDLREENTAECAITTISDIMSFITNEQPQEKKFYCKGSIVDISIENGWNYVGCAKCSKKLVREDTFLRCPQCDTSDVLGIIRYRLEIIVDDESARETFIIFDKEARNLTNILASDIVTLESVESEEQDLLPACLKELIGRNYIYEVFVKPFDFKARFKTLTVNRIITENPNLAHPVIKENDDTKPSSSKEGKVGKHLVRNVRNGDMSTIPEENKEEKDENDKKKDSSNKETKFGKQFVRRVKKENIATSHEEEKEEKKGIKRRGKRVKINPY